MEECEQEKNINKIIEKFNSIHKIKENTKVIRIGYYPFRGQAQTIRLLCQYMKIQYQDFFFSPLSWEKYKKNIREHWIPIDLPFIIDSDFLITQAVPSCLYLIEKYGRSELLGKQLFDRSEVEMFLWSQQMLTNIIASYANPDVSEQDKESFMKYAWQMHFAQKLNQYEAKASQGGGWYLGYLTIVDFFIYTLMDYIQDIFTDKAPNYPYLRAIVANLAKLNEIKQYENSDRAVKTKCPVQFFVQFKAYIEHYRQSRQSK